MTIPEFNTCVDLYSDSLYRFLLKNMKDTDKANDIVQDTYEKLWQKVSETEIDNVKSYMFTIAYNLMLRQYNRSAREVELDEIEESNAIEKEKYSDLKEILNEALHRLPEKQRSAILFRDYEGYNYEEIAKIMQIDPVLVRKYIFRARVTLKKHLVSIDNVI